MSSATITERYNVSDLEKLSEQGYRYELIKGELIEMAPPGGEHGSRTMDFAAYVTVHVLANRLGTCFAAETGFLVAQNPDTVLAPDFAFVARERLKGPPPRGYVPIVPDLVLETRSPR